MELLNRMPPSECLMLMGGKHRKIKVLITYTLKDLMLREALLPYIKESRNGFATHWLGTGEQIANQDYNEFENLFILPFIEEPGINFSMSLMVENVYNCFVNNNRFLELIANSPYLEACFKDQFLNQIGIWNLTDKGEEMRSQLMQELEIAEAMLSRLDSLNDEEKRTLRSLSGNIHLLNGSELFNPDQAEKEIFKIPGGWMNPSCLCWPNFRDLEAEVDHIWRIKHMND